MHMTDRMPARRRRRSNPESNPLGLENSQFGLLVGAVGLGAVALYLYSESKKAVIPPVTPPEVPPMAPKAKGYFVAEGIWYSLVDWRSRLGHDPAPIEWMRAISINTKLSQTISAKVYDRLLKFWQVYDGGDPTAEEFAAMVREVGAQNGWAESTGAA